MSLMLMLIKEDYEDLAEWFKGEKKTDTLEELLEGLVEDWIKYMFNPPDTLMYHIYRGRTQLLELWFKRGFKWNK